MMETNGTGAPHPANESLPAVLAPTAPVRATKVRALAPAAPEPLASKPSAMGLLKALRRRWLLAVSLGLLLAPPVAGAAWYLRPVTFTARTTLHVKSTENKILFDIPEFRADFSNYQRA